MAAEDAARGVGHRHVQVCAVGRQRAGQRQDLQVAAQLGGHIGAGKTQSRHAQAADALQHEGRGYALLAHRRRQRGAQVVARVQAQRVQAGERRGVHGDAAQALIKRIQAVTESELKFRRPSPIVGEARLASTPR